MHDLQQGELLFSHLVQPENEVGMCLPAAWGPCPLGQPLVTGMVRALLTPAASVPLAVGQYSGAPGSPCGEACCPAQVSMGGCCL